MHGQSGLQNACAGHGEVLTEMGGLHWRKRLEGRQWSVQGEGDKGRKEEVKRKSGQDLAADDTGQSVGRGPVPNLGSLEQRGAQFGK